MASESYDSIRLQMAMAFGQGAGSMLATPAALSFAMSSQSKLIERAAGDWSASQFAFIELVRVLGQIAATQAARDGKPRIEEAHVKAGLASVVGICPCFVRSPGE
jgi:hypothetical protein